MANLSCQNVEPHVILITQSHPSLFTDILELCGVLPWDAMAIFIVRSHRDVIVVINIVTRRTS